nr:DUF2141 domain-containing protein [Novosphingobium sp. AP12]
MVPVLSLVTVLPVAASTTPASTPDLGKAEARCRPAESGPSFALEVKGLKDRAGKLKLEVYPANDKDFLADDNVLISEDKTFRRVEVDVPASGPVRLCVRVPEPGRYAVSLLHDRDENRKFGWKIDGIGFAGNPRLGFNKPRADRAAATAQSRPTPLSIVLNYRRGLGVAPLASR